MLFPNLWTTVNYYGNIVGEMFEFIRSSTGFHSNDFLFRGTRFVAGASLRAADMLCEPNNKCKVAINWGGKDSQ